MKVPEIKSYALTYRTNPDETDTVRRTAAFEKLADLFNAIQSRESRFRTCAHYQGWPFTTRAIHLKHAEKIYSISIENPGEQDLAKIRLLGFSVALDEGTESGPSCM